MASRAEATNFIRHQIRVRELFMKDNRLSPLHVSLYFALFFEWNENRFQSPFFINRSEIMNASKIGSANTYTKCLKELDQFGYIQYLPSYNPNRGSQINLYTFDNGSDKGSDKGTDNGSDKGGVQVVIPFNKHYKHKKDNKDCKDALQSVSYCKDDLSIASPTKSKNRFFSSPTLDHVKSFFLEKEKSDLEAEKFFNHFESNGWLVGGKTKMKNWQAAARNWILNSEKFNSERSTSLSSGRLHVETNKSYDIPL